MKLPRAYPRIILRQPAGVRHGDKTVVLNDGFEVIKPTIAKGTWGDEEYVLTQVVADLSPFVRRIEIINEHGAPRLFRIEMYAGEVVCETDEKS